MDDVRYEYFGISHIGYRRTTNEDSWTAHDKHPFFAVADGMGGHDAGEVASSETISKLSQSIENLFAEKEINDFSIESLMKQLKKAVRKANTWVHHLSNINSKQRGMGTTLLCALMHKNHLIYAHVGDSRLYKFNEKLTLLTQDHTRERTTQPVKPHPHQLRKRHLLTRAIGPREQVHPELQFKELSPGDTYLLCSDGLSDYVTSDAIAAILKNPKTTLKEKSYYLVQAALDKGGHDNITALLFSISHES